jgi:hypothetical protein
MDRMAFAPPARHEDRPYGIDAGFRDPSGNSIRITQVRDLAAV